MSLQIAIVAAAFNEEIVGPMIRAAEAEIVREGGTLAQTVLVNGSYELALPVDLLLREKKIDMVIVLGFIEKGETLHGEVMGHVVHRLLAEAQLQHRKPVGLGIIGPGATPEQAETRKDAYARAAVTAAFAQHRVLETLAPERSTAFGF